MATLAFSSAGSSLSISAGVPATYDAAGFGALTYTVVKEVTEIGTLGKTFGLITHTPVNDPTTYKLKGIANSGNLSVKGARAPSDPGQTIFIAASDSQAPYSILITLADATKMYVQGLVMGYQTAVGGAGSITGFDATVELSGNIILA